MNCPLCNSTDNKKFEAGNRIYYLCQTCELTFMDSACHLSAEEEKKRYSFHQNNAEDNGYVAFLNRAIEPAISFLNKDMHGFDYGCGPNPVLAHLVSEKGFKCDFYDPYFFPECKFDRKYDFIFATECFEHFFNPGMEIERISELLKTNGILSIMTELWNPVDDFSAWYYKNDPTHVCFYSKNTIDYICDNFHFIKIYTDDKRVIILKKI